LPGRRTRFIFASLAVDRRGSFDGAQDIANMPFDDEPQKVRKDFDAVRARRPIAAARRETAATRPSDGLSKKLRTRHKL